VQYAAIEQTTRILRHMSYWLLTNQRSDLDIERAVRRFQPATAELMHHLASILGSAEQSRFAQHRAKLVGERVPEVLATRIASLDALHGALDVVEVSMATRLPDRCRGAPISIWASASALPGSNSKSNR
jgi:glutamate dehydrogenase